MGNNNEDDRRGDGDGDRRDDRPPSPSSRSKHDGRPAAVFLSNNFENYWRTKVPDDGESKKSGDDRDSPAEWEGSWNHFTSPLSSSSSSSSTSTSTSPKSPTTTSERSSWPRSSVLPSAFSDLERSRTADGFANVFMDRIGGVMSSGKLTKAWGSGGNDDGGIGGIGIGIGSLFSWLLKSDGKDNGSNEKNETTTRPSSSMRMINPDDYAAERRMIQPHITPFVWGSACAVATLFSLRFGRWRQGGGGLGHVVGSRPRAQGGGAYGRTTNNNNNNNNNDAKSPHLHRGAPDGNSPFDSAQRELKNSLMTSLNTLPVDAAVSLLVGISTTIFLTSPPDLNRDFSRAPLLEGRSALAETLCGPFREEMERVNGESHSYDVPYQRANVEGEDDDDDGPGRRRVEVVPYSEMWRDENLGEFDSLRAVRDFVSNCREREEAARRRTVAAADGDEVGGRE